MQQSTTRYYNSIISSISNIKRIGNIPFNMLSLTVKDSNKPQKTICYNLFNKKNYGLMHRRDEV